MARPGLQRQNWLFKRHDAVLVAYGVSIGCLITLYLGALNRPIEPYRTPETDALSGCQHCDCHGRLPSHSAVGLVSSPSSKIPRILHQVFISGKDDFERLARNPNSTFRPEWSRWCQAVHHGWEYQFWDSSKAEKLLQDHYPWFLSTWQSYAKVVSKGDAIRYFIMHKFGGLYIDLDVECFREGYDMLEGTDVVLQGRMKEWGLDLEIAMMASTPGHPLWEQAFKLLAERVHLTPIEGTGPGVITDSVRKLGLLKGVLHDANAFDGSHLWNGTIIKFYEKGEWFTPCWVVERECHRQLIINRTAGIYKPTLVGYHHYIRTWRKSSEAEGRVTDLPYSELVKQAICDEVQSRPGRD